jgi:glycerophosphoryl diester phosphodiesterase
MSISRLVQAVSGSVGAAVIVLGIALAVTPPAYAQSTTTDSLGLAHIRYMSHRGIFGEYPANSRQALETAAKDKSFFAVETDIWETSQGSERAKSNQLVNYKQALKEARRACKAARQEVKRARAAYAEIKHNASDKQQDCRELNRAKKDLVRAKRAFARAKVNKAQMSKRLLKKRATLSKSHRKGQKNCKLNFVLSHNNNLRDFGVYSNKKATSYTWEQIKNLKNPYIIDLNTYLGLCKKYNKVRYIHIKGSPNRALALSKKGYTKLVKMVKAKKLANNNTIFVSSCAKTLKQLKRVAKKHGYKNPRTMLIGVKNTHSKLNAAKRNNFDIVSMLPEQASPDVVRFCKRNDIKIQIRIVNASEAKLVPMLAEETGAYAFTVFRHNIARGFVTTKQGMYFYVGANRILTKTHKSIGGNSIWFGADGRARI